MRSVLVHIRARQDSDLRSGAVRPTTDPGAHCEGLRPTQPQQRGTAGWRPAWRWAAAMETERFREGRTQPIDHLQGDRKRLVKLISNLRKFAQNSISFTS